MHKVNQLEIKFDERKSLHFFATPNMKNNEIRRNRRSLAEESVVIG